MSTIVDELSSRLRESEAYARLRDELGVASGLPPAAAAWVIGLLASDLERPALVVLHREADVLTWLEAARLFAGGAEAVPPPPLTPYQETETSLQMRAADALAFERIAAARVRHLVVTPRTLFRRFPRSASWSGSVIELEVGVDLEASRVFERLTAAGYERTDIVTQIGEFAIRGGVVDVLGPGDGGAARLDLFGETIESIFEFDPGDQRSTRQLERTRILPLDLFSEDASASTRLSERLRSLPGAATASGESKLEGLERGRGFPGWQRLLPFIQESTRGLPELLHDPLVVVVEPDAVAAEITHHVETLERDAERAADRDGFALPTNEVETPEDIVRAWIAAAELKVDPWQSASGGSVDFGAVSTDVLHGQLPRFPREVETAKARKERLLLVAAHEQHDWLRRWLTERGLAVGPGGVELVSGEIRRGFRLPAAEVVLFGEAQLFPRRPSPSSAPAKAIRTLTAGLRDLRIGDYVVHREHGIGQFVALRTVAEEGADDERLPPALREASARAEPIELEVMEIEYSSGRRLLLPLHRLDLVERYSGLESVSPRLDRLGGSSWVRTKERVRSGMRQLATDLLKLYAERRLARAPAMPEPSDLYSQFEAAFEYDETTDQAAASRVIQEDLGRDQPMDRLLCGDVGFGKTEVAMRAAFRVVEGGYQAAILAPTTILADQHLETFLQRFAAFPVRIDVLSRFRTPADIRQVRERVEAGEIDVLIGTHRMLSADVKIPNLGLLIVDEEQRFGVAQKERLKELKRSVHVLAMSATPVPRTLQLSLAGVRDLSVIESPPRDRMAVETTIIPFGADIVREAIEFEVERGGQVFFVFNRVERIEEIAGWLRDLVPGLRLTIGHGQLEERELARRMHAFKRREYDLLLATTIIENGIDIPTVNTMFIHRADRFGLAQLYQLRGRVGRGSELAYCYLLTPTDRILSEDARKRLMAIREFTELGAGFRVAARDLEIRGAGNLLGAEQSGHIAAVGIETYLRMLEETVRELQGETVTEMPSAVVDLPVALTIPEVYVEDSNVRMELYRSLAEDERPREEILAELRDRFGPPPAAIETLVDVARIKRLAERLGVQSVSVKSSALRFRLRRESPLKVERLVQWIGERSDVSFSPSGVLAVHDVVGADAVGVALDTLSQLES